MARQETLDINGIPCVIETHGMLKLYYYETPEAFDECFRLYRMGIISPIQHVTAEPMDQAIANMSRMDHPEPMQATAPDDGNLVQLEGGSQTPPLPDLDSPIQHVIEDIEDQLLNTATDPTDQAIANMSWMDLPEPMQVTPDAGKLVQLDSDVQDLSERLSPPLADLDSDAWKDSWNDLIDSLDPGSG